MSKIYYCTPEGYSQLLSLKEGLLKKHAILIIEAAEAIKGSSEDLGENSEYLQAKEELDRIEIKLMEIKDKLSISKIIDISKIPLSNKVIFGSTVTILNLDNEKEFKFKIVGIDESDIKGGKISLESPLAKEMLGCLEGDEFYFEIENNDYAYEVLKIEYI